MRKSAVLAVALALALSTPAIAQQVPDAETVVLDAFEGATQGQTHGTVSYGPSLPGLGEAVDLGAGGYVEYAVPGWYPSPGAYEPAGKEGTIEAWVLPRQYPAEFVTLQWFDSTTPPASGYIGHFGIDGTGHATFGSWSSVTGAPAVSGPLGSSVVPLDEWTHLAVTWGGTETRIYVNGVLDASAPANLYPALQSTFFVYLNGWGGSDLGLLDEFRISEVARSEAELSEYVQATLAEPDADGEPAFEVHVSTDDATGVFVKFWPHADTVDVTIDDHTTAASPDYQTEVVVAETSADGYGGGVNVDYRVRPGDEVTVTDGATTKIHEVIDVLIASVDLESDRVSGTVPVPNSPVAVYVAGASANRWVTADPVGDWIADFSVSDGVDHPPFDLVAGTAVGAEQFDADGDSTVYDAEAARPAGWRHNPVTGHDYLYVNDPMPWAEAEAYAVSLGGHLVTINDAAEDAWLVATLGTDYWIGLNDIAAEGVWAWSSGDPVGFTNWLSSEPNDAAPGEDAGRIENRPPTGWNDLPDDASIPFVVEGTRPAPTFWVTRDWSGLVGDGWPAEVELEVSADDPDTGEAPDIVLTLATDVDGFFERSDVFPGLEPGWLITVTDGETTKTHTVRAISITEMDTETDIVRGTADPGTDVWVSVGDDAGYWLTADASGEWLADFHGDYDITPGIQVTVSQEDEDLDFTWSTQEVRLPPIPIPSGTSLTSNDVTATAGTPGVYWGYPLTVSTTTGRSGGSGAATFSMIEGYEQTITLAEGPPGTYTATFSAPLPHHGPASISITIRYPDGDEQVATFTLYIDPSGVVRDTAGVPVVGATVTLYRSVDPDGPFVAVSDGSAIMSPGNRTNPDLTGTGGLFGWDVVPGYYKVRAEKGGCSAPGGGAAAETAVLTIPPPVTDLALVLDCTVATKLAFGVQPSNEQAGSPIVPAVTVRILDAAGALVRTDNTTIVELSLSTNPSAGTLSGTVVRTAFHGLATFPGLSIDKAGHGFRLAASAVSLTGATSKPFSITSGPAVSLRVAGYPTPTTAFASHTFTVSALDAFGNTATGYTGTIHFTSNDGAAVLPRNYRFTSSDHGIRTFRATFATASPPDRAITATDVSRPWINGSQSGIVVSGPTIDHITIAPASSTLVAGASRSYTVIAYDTSSHSLGTVTAALSVAPNGSCSVSSCTATMAGAHTVTATYAGRTATATLNIVAGPAAGIVFGQQPTNARRNQVISPAVTVRVVDAYGNLATAGNYLVAIGIGSNPGGGTLAGTILRVSSHGLATFNNLSINRTGSGYRLAARAFFVGVATTNPFNITP